MRPWAKRVSYSRTRTNPSWPVTIQRQCKYKYMMSCHSALLRWHCWAAEAGQGGREDGSRFTWFNDEKLHFPSHYSTMTQQCRAARIPHPIPSSPPPHYDQTPLIKFHSISIADWESYSLLSNSARTKWLAIVLYVLCPIRWTFRTLHVDDPVVRSWNWNSPWTTNEIVLPRTKLNWHWTAGRIR